MPLDERIVALETRITYQDEAIESLNATVTAQWKAVDALTREVTRLRDRLSEAEARSPASQTDEAPPHY